MQIRPTGQPVPVSKVETDRREEVSKIKPIGSQQIPDSFEKGGLKSADNQSNSSASAEPAKKAGQITGGILIKQMTQARLAESGIRVPTSSKETKGKKDLSETQQNQAENTSPKVSTKGNSRTPGSTTPGEAEVPEGAFTGDARSNLEKNKGALQDLFAQHNIDVPSTGTGTQTSTTGGGINASDFGVGQGVDLGNGFNGGPTGPGDPMDNVNDQFARMDYLNGVGNAGNRLSSQMQDAAQGMDGATHYFEKDMIAANGDINNSYTRTNPDGSTTTIKDTGHVNPEDPEDFSIRHSETTDLGFGASYNVRETRDSNSFNHTEFTKVGDLIRYKQNASWVDEDGNTHTKTEVGVATKKGDDVTITESKSSEVVTDPNGNVISTTTTTVETKKGKTTTTTTTTGPSAESSDPDKYKDPEVEKMRQQMDQMSKNLGMDGLWNLHRGPKNQGKGPDYGPEPVGISKDDASPGMISQFGEHGMVGQPNQDAEVHDGDNANFHGLPGDTVTDPEDGDPYHGSHRNEEVSTAPKTGMEENVDDDEEEKKAKLKMEFKPPTGLPRYNKL